MSDHFPFIKLEDAESGAPLYRQIYESIRRSILSGEFAAGSRLPATRQLADSLGVSRITVVNAYDQLFAEGYLEGKKGSGTFVGREMPEELLNTANTDSDDVQATAPLRLSAFGERLAATGVLEDGRSASIFQPFQNGLTAVDRFPFEAWARIAARIHRNPPRSVLGYGEPQGYLPLRRAVADHLRSARGVTCTPHQVIITAGAQQALDLTSRIFLGEGDTVLIEDPCYQAARNSFLSTGANVVSVPVDAEGIDVGRAPKGRKAPKLVYVTPSHQYPLGVTMSLPRRLALIEWAKQKSAWIIEDDYNSEFRYAGRPLASLQGLDRDGRVIYIGTFSKTVFPSLRIGCVVVPPELVDIFTAARAVSDVHSSLIDQAILAEFITAGHFARHVRRMRQLYQQRQEFLVEECERELNGLLGVSRADAGMHIVGWLPPGVDDRKVAEGAEMRGMKLSAVSSYSERPMERGGLILGYTAFDENEIRRGVKKMQSVLKQAATGATGA